MSVPSRGVTAAVVAEVRRSGFVEGHHRGHVIVLDPDGATVLALGDPSDPVLPRSSLKPLQLVGMLRCGLRAGSEEIAVAASSHSGEAAHVAAVGRLLAAHGLTPAALQNTPGLPMEASRRSEVLRAGEGPTSVTGDCSGKHAAMLSTCVIAGWETASYRDPDHPLQRAIRAAVEDLTAESVAAVAVDGCGAPAFTVSLAGLARAFARLATAAPGTPEGVVAGAMRTHPWMVGGTGREVTTALRAVPGLVAKDGAEGCFGAGLADGHGIAVKIEDGGGRAAAPVLAAALVHAGVDGRTVEPFASSPVLGHGENVGDLRPSF